MRPILDKTSDTNHNTDSALILNVNDLLKIDANAALFSKRIQAFCNESNSLHNPSRFLNPGHVGAERFVPALLLEKKFPTTLISRAFLEKQGHVLKTISESRDYKENPDGKRMAFYHKLNELLNDSTDTAAVEFAQWCKLMLGVAYFQIYGVEQPEPQEWVKTYYRDQYTQHDDSQFSLTVFAKGLVDSVCVNLFPSKKVSAAYLIDLGGSNNCLATPPAQEAREETLRAINSYINDGVIAFNSKTGADQLAFFTTVDRENIANFIAYLKTPEGKQEAQDYIAQKQALALMSELPGGVCDDEKTLVQNVDTTSIQAGDVKNSGAINKSNNKKIAAISLLLLACAVCIVLAVASFGISTPLSTLGIALAVGLTSQTLTIAGGSGALGTAAFFSTKKESETVAHLPKLTD